MRLLHFAAVAILLAGCTPPPQSAAPSLPADAVAWTQYGLGDSPGLIARALVNRADNCPTVEWNGAAVAMSVRDPNRVEAYGKLCESRRPFADSLKITIRLGGTVLLQQQVTSRPERIAVIGDTGCRITYYADQGCHDQKTWPFATVAQSVASQQPDLILHLGDYYYREVPCLAAATTCPPGPYGDREQTWRAEFFEPARPLIARAPWVLARGNHEDCQRGGYGWSYYFGDEAAACDTTHKPAVIRLSGLTVVNFDTAQTGNAFLVGNMESYWYGLAQTLGTMRPTTPGQPILLMSHEPGYFVCASASALQTCPDSLISGIGNVRGLSDAARKNGWRTILLSGHIHAFRSIDVVTQSGQPVSQVVVGTSGANQNDDPTPPILVPPQSVNASFHDVRLAPQGDPKDPKTKWVPQDLGTVPMKVQGWTDFGFGMLSASSLQLVMFNALGQPKFTCALADETKTPRCR
jgi:hypothetical protein